MTKVVHSISNGSVDINITDGITVKVYTQPPAGTTFTCTQIATCIHSATNKATPVDADEFGIWDSVTSLLNRVSWANIKATLKTYFDTLYQAAGSYLTTITHAAITTTPHVTDVEKSTWNAKQDSLGYTPENTANKKTTLTDSDTDYPTTKAVNTGLSGKLSTALVEEVSFQDINEDITATTYTLILYAEYACTINELKIIAGAGTATAAIQIDGVSVTGISAVAVSNVMATGTATALNTVAVGNKITLVITSPTGLDNLQATLKTTRI